MDTNVEPATPAPQQRDAADDLRDLSAFLAWIRERANWNRLLDGLAADDWGNG